ncbi:sterol delta-7 reductase [Aureococcus anophagefferens]|nr:sterol delta-7 reductase [Aureococcus anophagefferens]
MGNAKITPTSTVSVTPTSTVSVSSQTTTSKASPPQAMPHQTMRVIPKPEEPDEFGGPVGVAVIILLSHCVVYGLYLSIEASTSPFKSCDETWLSYASRARRGLAGAAPTATGFCLYAGFLAATALLSAFCPGATVRGRPLPSLKGRADLQLQRARGLGRVLSGLAALHLAGVLRLAVWMDHFGSVLTWSVIFGDGVAVLTHGYCRRGSRSDSGRPLYDGFMGVTLNPRVGPLDLKMWSELRVPWILLFVITLSAASKQYETTGRCSPQLAFMVLAHFLYANACAKGDHCVPTTWDIFHEHWGWMLIFWNLCGVPLTYCAASRWLLAHAVEGQAPAYTAAVYALLLAAYYVFDTANAQKNEFRLRRAGVVVDRRAWHLPWAVLDDPRFLKTAGAASSVDGWRAARSPPRGRRRQALLGLICGSDVTHWYALFFVPMIVHRAWRDDARCAAKYGADWDAYKARVPYVLVPGVV